MKAPIVNKLMSGIAIGFILAVAAAALLLFNPPSDGVPRGGAVAPQAEAQTADLVVSAGQISFEPLHPKEGEQVFIGVTVMNRGTAGLSGVKVQIFDGLPGGEGKNIAEETISVAAASQETVSSALAPKTEKLAITTASPNVTYLFLLLIIFNPF